jgi:hypothetical protein
MTILTPSPPSILGGLIPHPGLAPTAIDDVTINGWGLKSNLADVMTDISIAFDIDGTSTVTMQVEDDHRVLLNSPLAQQKSYIDVGGVTFVASQFKKSGPQMQITFDHEVVSKLNDHTDIVVVAPNTISRTAFIRMLASNEPWIDVQTPSGDSPGNDQSALTVGNVDPSTGQPTPPSISTVSEIPESYWDAAGRVLNEIGWRRLTRGQNVLLLVPDSWLYTQGPAYIISESSPGVDSIDFDWDVRKPLATCTITCRAEAWAFPVGSVVRVISCGIATGAWLVTNINRSLLSSSAVVKLDQPKPTVPEPAAGASSSTDSATAAIAAALGLDVPNVGSVPPGAEASIVSASVAVSSEFAGLLGGGVSKPSSNYQANQNLGQQMCAAAGWTGSQWVAFNNTEMAEAGWNERARNPKSGALGIPQALPPQKLLDPSQGGGADGYTNPRTQINWMITYIRGRYKTPVAAWQFHLSHGWY